MYSRTLASAWGFNVLLRRCGVRAWRVCQIDRKAWNIDRWEPPRLDLATYVKSFE
jgi:hypothetical protein